MEVKISVIVPVYNIEQFLPNCIDSLIDQSFKDIEIILVNDGSSDNSPNICNEYAIMDKRIKVIHKKNEGVSVARNTGLRVAKGEFIAFVDGDDWVEHDIYSLMYNKITTSKADLIMCRFFNFSPNGDFEIAKEPLKSGVYSNNEIFQELVLPMLGNKFVNLSENLIMGSIWRCLYKREIIYKNNMHFPEVKIAEDMLFHLNYQLACKKVVILDKALYYYRYNPSSATKKYITSLLDTLIYQLELVEKTLINFNMLNESSRERMETTRLYFCIWCITNECHPNNPKQYSQSIKYLKNISKLSIFKQTFKWKNIFYAPLKQRLLLICIKLQLFSLVFIYHRKKLKKS
ncbi:MAG TPA: glycosyltransferase [Niallia sp.]|nr:glycosyltransferase [Niallia sp.]